MAQKMTFANPVRPVQEHDAAQVSTLIKVAESLFDLRTGFVKRGSVFLSERNPGSPPLMGIPFELEMAR